MPSFLRPRFAFWVLLGHALSVAAIAQAQEKPAIVHVIRLAHAVDQVVEVQTTIPATGESEMEIAMPVWSPGFYVQQNYADDVSDVSAKTPDGKTLDVRSSSSNRWAISANPQKATVVTYRMKCERCSVTTNWIGDTFAVFNGGASYFNLKGDSQRPHRVRLELPPEWQAFSGLDSSPDAPNEFIAADYDTLVDSPIVAGKGLGVHEFTVEGTTHVLVDAGEHPGWDGMLAAKNIQKIVQSTHDFWGQLPFRRYVFLNLFNEGNGGLEHLNSTLISTRLRPDSRNAAPWNSFRWLAFVSHEYFHSFNVKRLRPLELGPFDYERPPRTASLWISEGLTSYYGDLLTVRAGLGTTQDFLTSMSSYIGQLQDTPGRKVQTLEQASLDVWTTSMSGVSGNRDKTVSYYVKGPVVGFLLDAKIRRATDGNKSLDDVMRLAYKQYSGERGFTPAEFVAVAEEIAQVDLDDWFRVHLATTDELDYSEALDWFGLALGAESPDKPWDLSVRPDANEKQRAQLQSLTGSDAATTTAK